MAQLQDAADDRDLNNEIKDEKHRKKRAKQRFNGHGPQVVEPMGIFDPSSFIPSRPPPPTLQVNFLGINIIASLNLISSYVRTFEMLAKLHFLFVNRNNLHAKV